MRWLSLSPLQSVSLHPHKLRALLTIDVRLRSARVVVMVLDETGGHNEGVAVCCGFDGLKRTIIYERSVVGVFPTTRAAATNWTAPRYA
ncbi:hypothetical protein E3N88_34884 [Mikania micrantha]|uniref:Uncharacterized protein n=1 Tax=Mikania micrantha TaxID=192012 RepID=A0A5N6LZE8_9ASTR|nr:hypothetical protein E3N88_34884 [Mikania micrantha]